MEIDVIGTNNKLAIVADANIGNDIAIHQYQPMRKTNRRTKILCRTKRRTNITSLMQSRLYDSVLHRCKILDGVPIVPISKFKSFIEDVSLYLSELES